MPNQNVHYCKDSMVAVLLKTYKLIRNADVVQNVHNTQ